MNIPVSQSFLPSVYVIFALSHKLFCLSASRRLFLLSKHADLEAFGAFGVIHPAFKMAPVFGFEKLGSLYW